MAQYTSYYLYQKFEKRDGQDYIPVYPNIYSIDGDGTQPKVIRKENDEECGYIPPYDPIYRWKVSGYICDNCPEYRWITIDPSIDYYCSGTTKYYKQKEQVSYDEGSTWEDVSPAEYRWGSSAETQSTDCGYAERWINLDPSTDYYCSGTTKYYKQQKQVSYDSGSTWEDVSPAEYRWGSSAETQSTDCGYIPPCYCSDLTIIDYSKQYFTLIPRNTGTKFQFFSASGDSISYSLDSGSTWNTLASGSATPYISVGQKVMWKATNLKVSSTDLYRGIGRFASSGASDYYDVEGNIMSLVSGDSFANATVIPNEYQFVNLFNNCVENAENLILPATTLKNRCYANMFGGWGLNTPVALTKAPKILPATTLANNCYQQMFDGCSGLTTTPQLPATTLATGCYYLMFNGCTSLTTAQEILPATTLATYCYENMFAGCTSLTTAPELPATTLAEACYDDMFNGCTSLTTAPQLSATTLTDRCYLRMFKDCTSLNYVKCLATDISASSCTTDWLNGVSSSGTFVKNSSMSNWTSGVDGIPTNWTIQNA